MDRKIILEEHFSTELNNQFWDADGENQRNGQTYAEDVAQRLLDPELCLAEMDQAGIDHCVLSLTSPGVQSVSDAGKARELAQTCNDHLHSIMQRNPDRFSGFAALAVQDPRFAADELQRCVEKLGFKGALINGYSNLGPGESVQYLDEEPVRELWDRAAKLDVPIYLHPREPLESQTRTIEGLPELVGSAWGFGYETASHAIRLMLSDVFDVYPNLQIILGHLGEGLPFLLPRLQHRLKEQRYGMRGARAKHRPSDYFSNNFWITTSGHFHRKALLNSIEEVGVERLLFSVDYPFEQMGAGADWFDDLDLEGDTQIRIGRENAVKLLRLNLPSRPVLSA